MTYLRQAAKLLPDSMQAHIKRGYYAHQIRRAQFVSPEKEFSQLSRWVADGDWALDIGANVGHYTRALSAIVGSGRVIAVEPHPQTFSYLACNTADLDNVTLINAAATGSTSLLGFEVPEGNFYCAGISQTGTQKVMGLNVGVIDYPGRIAFIKIDVEGHDMEVLESLAPVIQRDMPVLMVENHGKALRLWASENNYFLDDLPRSHNHILRSKEAVKPAAQPAPVSCAPTPGAPLEDFAGAVLAKRRVS